MKAHCATEPVPKILLPKTFERLKWLPNPVQIKNLSHQQLIDVPEEIALGMGRETDQQRDAAAGMTFFGQFVDHDITLDVTSALGTPIEPATIRHVRSPSLDLDCVYGGGPEATPQLYGSGDVANSLVYGNGQNPFDLARTTNGAALVGDPRHDENDVVSQNRANMIAVHSILMGKCLSDLVFSATWSLKRCAASCGCVTSGSSGTNYCPVLSIRAAWMRPGTKTSLAPMYRLCRLNSAVLPEPGGPQCGTERTLKLND
ncbi:hypothetical protein [Yoonia sediminilitoris]|nr:hypothetical protein [Yoonia sediminilitoris]